VIALLPCDNGPRDDNGPPFFEVELRATGSTCSLMLRGELCGSSLPALETQVDQLGCMPCERVIVDLHQLQTLDPVGARVIVGLYYYVVGKGGELRVTKPNDQVAATLRAAGGDVIPLERGGSMLFSGPVHAPAEPSSFSSGP
jgi:anti-anti-sigma factor